VEADGTVRLVLASKGRFPGLIIKRKERPHPGRQAAGLLFFDDEGTESGGLTYGGGKNASGKVSSYGHLSFDQYQQDQVLSIDAADEGGRRQVGVTVVDRPDYPITDVLEALDGASSLAADKRAAAMKAFMKARPQAHQRLTLGRAGDRSVGLRLKDAEGRDRVVIKVAADGTPAIQILDQSGKVTVQLPPGPRG
jgi:hypothetical protein